MFIAFQVAISRFYETDGELDEPEHVPVEPRQNQPDVTVSPSAPPAAKQKPKKNTKFATVHTLSNSSDDEEEGQAFYAGGSEHSGQQVLGPPKKDIVADMFKSVQE